MKLKGTSIEAVAEGPDRVRFEFEVGTNDRGFRASGLVTAQNALDIGAAFLRAGRAANRKWKPKSLEEFLRRYTPKRKTK